ncbi:hypothetical protein J4461_00115 [Candidatus Pacearchaeota archaeon]|nr:hypothetical protein [Candidatus Pacearchaeota archaeon]
MAYLFNYVYDADTHVGSAPETPLFLDLDDLREGERYSLVLRLDTEYLRENGLTARQVRSAVASIKLPPDSSPEFFISPARGGAD